MCVLRKKYFYILFTREHTQRIITILQRKRLTVIISIFHIIPVLAAFELLTHWHWHWLISFSPVTVSDLARRDDWDQIFPSDLWLTPVPFDLEHAPLPFGHICFVVLVTRKGGESSWSGRWHLGCTSEVFHVHSYQDQFIQPGWAECVFIFSLGLYFVCLYCFNLFVCPHPFVFPWAVESSPLQVLALA